MVQDPCYAVPVDIQLRPILPGWLVCVLVRSPYRHSYPRVSEWPESVRIPLLDHREGQGHLSQESQPAQGQQSLNFLL